MDTGQLPLPIGAQSFVGTPGADTFFEHRIQRAFDLMKVSGNNSFRQPVGDGAGNGVCCGSKEEAASSE